MRTTDFTCIAPVLSFALSVALAPQYSLAQTMTETAHQWEQHENRCDIREIRFSKEMVTDISKAFLTVPAACSGLYFDVAKTPPVIDFGIIQGYDPWYLPVLYSDDRKHGGVWEGYGDVTKGPDGCFYFSIGDHRSYGGNAYIVSYDPEKKRQQIVVDLRAVVGWDTDDYADSKIHGDLDIDSRGDMWFLTYFGPFPTREEWDTIYRGSLLMKYNVFSGKIENFGIPLEGSTWPYYNYDFDRGLFFAAAEEDGVVFVYDVNERRMLYGGAPKHGMSWHRRCTMLDHDTGFFYSTDTVTYKDGERYRGDQYIIRYQKRNNAFTRMKSKVPANPATGKPAPLRAHTSEKDDDGAFWCFSENGFMFRFFPAEDRIEPIGLNWGREGTYITNMSFSPKKRYIYYIARSEGMPVVQYDTKTRRPKVIAFLDTLYPEKYGYRPLMSYGLELDEKGETLFCYCSGGFAEKGQEPPYSRPAMFHIHIPPSERIE